MAVSREAVEVFYSYAHEDEHLRNELEKHLRSLERQGFITHWHDRQIIAGTEWAQATDSHLNTASIILLLISPDFMASDYCYTVEMNRAMERHNAKEACVIPVILRPTDLQGAPFEKLQPLPTNARPVTTWPNREEAFLDVVRGIRRVIVEDLSSSSSGFATIPSSEQFWNIPYPRNPFFTGQEALLISLHAKLQGDQAVALTQSRAISGLGGIGKTEIAIEYAYRHRADYRAVLWASADSRESLVSDFVAIANHLHLLEKDARNQNEIIKAVKRWLETHGPWLLIFDNADDIMLARDFLPLGGKGHILFTTRAKAVGSLAKGIEKVEQMSSEEGMLFLLRRARVLSLNDPLDCASAADRAAAQDIVQELGGLPLALDQAGAYIEETACSTSDYVSRYRVQHAKLLRRRGNLATGHPEPVATTWSLNFEKIEQINPCAAELLRLCAFFYPDSIPEEFITEEAPRVSVRLQAYANDLIALDEAMQALHAYSLVHRDARTRTLSVHRLVQVVQRDRMNEDQQRYWATQAVQIVSDAFPSGKSATWPLCERYLLHAEACANLIEQWKMTSSEASSLLESTGDYLYARARYKEATLLQQQALTINELVKGPNHSDVADILSNLAVVHAMQGHYEQAESLNQRALAIYENVRNPNRSMMAQTLTNLAAGYERQGHNEQAASLYQRALALREREIDPGSLDMLHGLIDLAESYASQDHNEQAISLKNAPGIYERLESSSIADSFHALAVLHFSQGHYESVTSLLQRTLAIYERMLDPDYLKIARDLALLAAVYDARGRDERAQPLLQRALTLHEKVLGPDHPDVAHDLANLAILYYNKGKYKRTESLYLRALAIYEKKLGPDHPNVTEILSDLVALYATQEKYAKAEPLYRRILDTYMRTSGLDHPNIVTTLNSYADLLRELKRWSAAKKIEALVQKIRKIRNL